MHAPTISTPSDPSLSIDDLRTLISKALTDGLTGQIQIAFQNDKVATLFALHGNVRQVYIRNHRAPNTDWEFLVDQFGEGTLDIQPMPARAFPFAKIILEETDAPEPEIVETTRLETLFNQAERDAGATLFHIRWEGVEGFVLVAGRNIPLRRAALVNQTGDGKNADGLEQLSLWEEAQYSVTMYRADIKRQAWLEVHLNILFEWYCAHILKQYSLLTGTVMVRSVLRSIASLAERNGWRIAAQNLEVKDETLFADSAQAGDAYREILLSILASIEPVVGGALTRNILKQLADRTRDVYASIMEVYHLTERAEP